MAMERDATEFVDQDYQEFQRNPLAASMKTPESPEAPVPEGPRSPAAPAGRAPTPAEVDQQVGQLQSKLAELRRAQESLEREKAGLEETRRRQAEFRTGREEIIRDLNRGIALLAEKETTTRREAEQMSRALVELRDSVAKVEAIQEQHWSQERYQAELSNALGLVDHARMEWNSARLKFPVLDGAPTAAAAPERPQAAPWQGQSFSELTRMGLALTWPLVAGLVLLAVVLLFR